MDGRIDAEIALVGEAPGFNEVAQKSPFIGESGRILWNTLRQHSILRTQCYITNVSKRPVSTAKENTNAMSGDEWVKWKYLLIWELEQLPNLKYIFGMGNAALEALSGYKGIDAYRGSVYEIEINGRQVQVLYANNPAAVIREPKREIIFQFDARRLANLIKGDFAPTIISTEFNFSYDRAREVIASYRHAKLDVSVDIETTAYQTACVGLANNAETAHCINFRDRITNIYTLDQEYQLWLDIQELYDSGVKVIAQNGAFDAGWHAFKDHVYLPVHFDTMLAHHTLYPSLPHNLGFLTSQYTTHPYYKDELDAWRETGNIDQFWEYNGKDCCITWIAAQKLTKELKDQGLYDFFINHVMHLSPHLVVATANGIAVDTSIKEKIARELEIDVKAKLKQFFYSANLALGLDTATDENGKYQFEPNPGSPKQLQDLYYNKLGLKHRAGNTAAPTRAAMIEDVRTPLEAKNVLVAHNIWAKDQKFYSTYAETGIDEDHRMRCVWKQAGVSKAPGRLSSASTLWGTGGNMQNQPTKAQQFYVADPDCVLVYFDLSQAEARVVGYVADIDKWKQDFERSRLTGDYDCHRALAAEMFKVPYVDVPTSDQIDDEFTIRYIAKRCRHGLNYRMGIPRLAETTGLSYSRAASSYHAYHRISPEIAAWWKETERQVRKDRQLFNAFGRRWRLMQRLDDPDALESIVAFYPQSTIGDKVGKVWYQCEEDDAWDSARMKIAINVHDALIGIAHRDYAKDALRIMKRHAEEPIMIENVYKTKREQLIIPAETKISTLDITDKLGNVIGQDKFHRWSNMKKISIDTGAVA